MFAFLSLVTAFFWILFLLLSLVRVRPSSLSRFELERRAPHSSHTRQELRRERLLPAVYAAQYILVSLLLISAVLLSVATYGWGVGALISFTAILLAGLLPSWRALTRAVQELYSRYEPSILKGVERVARMLEPFYGVSVHEAERFRHFDSREELLFLVEHAQGVLSDQEQRIIAGSLEFPRQSVSSAMTPRSNIHSIEKSEFLGPLVLSEIHQYGHSRLPVIENDLDHVVGILYLRDLLSLDERRSTTAGKAMDKKVYYIHQDDTLEHALAALLKTHHHLCIVINDARETVGLLSLEDVIEALIGREIIDEDDHTDVQAIAARKNDNNRPAGRVDL